MAVQIYFPDGTAQWVNGTLYQGRAPLRFNVMGFCAYDDGFTVAFAGVDTDYGRDHAVISTTPNDNVTDWSRRTINTSANLNDFSFKKPLR